MQLSINFSPAAAKLVQTGKIDIDYFKIPDWNWMVEEAKSLRPVTVHFTLEAGNAALEQVDWEVVEHLAELTATPYINLHLDSRREYFPDLPVASTDPTDMKRVLAVMMADVTSVVDRFGSERVIIENSPYRSEFGNTLRACVEPDLISRVVEETGCGFLLDISHAYITAHYMSMDAKTYFAHLPIQHVKEMHFAGIHHQDGQLVDHLSILDADWHKLDWALENIRSGEWSEPWMLAFEYGGVGEEFGWRSDPDVIADQVPRLREKLSLPG